MRYAVALAGFAVIAIVTIIGQRRTGEKPGTRALRDLARTVRAPLTPELEAWLRPQLRRREEWIGMGATLGLVAGHLPFMSYRPDRGDPTVPTAPAVQRPRESSC